MWSLGPHGEELQGSTSPAHPLVSPPLPTFSSSAFRPTRPFPASAAATPLVPYRPTPSPSSSPRSPTFAALPLPGLALPTLLRFTALARATRPARVYNLYKSYGRDLGYSPPIASWSARALPPLWLGLYLSLQTAPAPAPAGPAMALTRRWTPMGPRSEWTPRTLLLAAPTTSPGCPQGTWSARVRWHMPSST